MSPREWDASGYDGLVLPHRHWGHWVLDGLVLDGDECVVDIGAGTGRDTEALVRRLPQGYVVAVDGSRAMLDRLRLRLAAVDPQRLHVVCADLAAPLPALPQADAVVSVATLHWLRDHDAVFRSLVGLLRPGGVLRAEWGGFGNVANVDRALVGLDVPRLSDVAHYATTGDTAARLRAAGFTGVEVEAVSGRFAVPGRGEDWRELLRVVVLGPVLDHVPAVRRCALVDQVAARLGDDGVEYVRLHVTARRPGPGGTVGGMLR